MLMALLSAHHAGCSKRPSSKAAADESTGSVASGYVEDAFEGENDAGGLFQHPAIARRPVAGWGFSVSVQQP